LREVGSRFASIVIVIVIVMEGEIGISDVARPAIPRPVGVPRAGVMTPACIYIDDPTAPG
jgi:hypothetical protein